jgi:hypothetical protein
VVRARRRLPGARGFGEVEGLALQTRVVGGKFFDLDVLAGGHGGKMLAGAVGGPPDIEGDGMRGGAEADVLPDGRALL